jgi:hypothetical protein
MPPLPWPAETFLTDSAVRLALSRSEPSLVAFVALFASASWLEEDGTLPDDAERLAAILGLDDELCQRAVEFWTAEGKLKREGKRLYFPWVTRPKAAAAAEAQARSEQGTAAAHARWRTPAKGENLTLMPAASDSHADSTEWPKNYTTHLCDLWIARWGEGSAPGDVIAMNARQIKKGGAAWDEVYRSFRRYVETVEERYASPAAWRKRWRAYDPEEPEHDHEAAQVADSWDRQRRQRGKGGLRPAAEGLLPGGKE